MKILISKAGPRLLDTNPNALSPFGFLNYSEEMTLNEGLKHKGLLAIVFVSYLAYVGNFQRFCSL
jgi:hypothetical protein